MPPTKASEAKSTEAKSTKAQPTDPAVNTAFIQRVLSVILIIAVACLTLKLFSLWLVVFGAILIATVLRGLAEPLIRYTPIKPQFAVAIVLVLLLAIIATTLYLFGRELADQMQILTRELPAAWANLQVQLQASEVGRLIQAQVATLGQQAGGAASKLPMIAGNILSSAASTFIALIAGIILAMNPARYRDGVVVLFPTRHHDRLRDAMNAAGQALRLWFIAQFISMIIVGVLVGIGLSIVGLRSSLALGLLAGLAQFVPFVGPTISACTGILLAGVVGVPAMGFTFLTYFLVSQTEANFITPFVQRRIASVPVVLTLFAVIGFAGLLGAVGVLFALPLTVVAHTLVQRYLKERDGTATGEVKNNV